MLRGLNVLLSEFSSTSRKNSFSRKRKVSYTAVNLSESFITITIKYLRPLSGCHENVQHSNLVD